MNKKISGLVLMGAIFILIAAVGGLVGVSTWGGSWGGDKDDEFDIFRMYVSIIGIWVGSAAGLIGIVLLVAGFVNKKINYLIVMGAIIILIAVVEGWYVLCLSRIPVLA